MQSLKLRLEALEAHNLLQTHACPKRIYLCASSQGFKTPTPASNQTAAQWLALLPTEILSALVWRHE